MNLILPKGSLTVQYCHFCDEKSKVHFQKVIFFKVDCGGDGWGAAGVGGGEAWRVGGVGGGEGGGRKAPAHGNHRLGKSQVIFARMPSKKSTGDDDCVNFLSGFSEEDW